MERDLREELAALKRKIVRLEDEAVRSRRYLSDLLCNLDGENMPAVKEYIDKADGENARATAAVRQTAAETGAAVALLAERQTASEAAAASVEARVDDNGARIALLVEKNAAGYAVRGAEIVAAVNAAGSSVRIAAEKIDLDGVTTFARTASLAGGTTVIDGACIRTGTLSAGALRTGGSGTTGTALASNLVFNADVLTAAEFHNRGIYFADPALYSVFIDTESRVRDGVVQPGQILRLHSQGAIRLESTDGVYLGAAEAENRVATLGDLESLGLSGRREINAGGSVLTFENGILTAVR